MYSKIYGEEKERVLMIADACASGENSIPAVVLDNETIDDILRGVIHKGITTGRYPSWCSNRLGWVSLLAHGRVAYEIMDEAEERVKWFWFKVFDSKESGFEIILKLDNEPNLYRRHTKNGKVSKDISKLTSFTDVSGYPGLRVPYIPCAIEVDEAEILHSLKYPDLSDERFYCDNFYENLETIHNKGMYIRSSIVTMHQMVCMADNIGKILFELQESGLKGIGTVNHKNNQSNDFRPCNLEICSYAYNSIHGRLWGLVVDKLKTPYPEQVYISCLDISESGILKHDKTVYNRLDNKVDQFIGWMDSHREGWRPKNEK